MHAATPPHPIHVIRPVRAIGIAVLAVALAGCATTRVTAPAVPVEQAQAMQAARAASLRADTAWGLTGRVAVSNAGQGGSARMEWRQDGPRFEVVLSAPVSRQSWRLTGAPGHARLEGLDGGPREGGSAAALLYEATRWDIPVDAMPDWLRGLATPGVPAAMAFGADGRPARLEQGGWTIDYAWPADPAARLPSRLDARRGQARVRLAIDDWTSDPP